MILETGSPMLGIVTFSMTPLKLGLSPHVPLMCFPLTHSHVPETWCDIEKYPFE